MSNYKATTIGNTKRRLFKERETITPKEKRITTSAIQKAQIVKGMEIPQKKEASKKTRVTMTKQELMKQHTDLLEELQNARLQLEDAQKEQARLRRELKKVQARYGGGQQNADNDDGYYSNGGGYSSDEYDEDDDQQQPRRRR